MMGLKKIYRDELLQIAILVSLMRVDPISYLGHLPQSIGIGTDDLHNDTTWSSLNSIINRRLYIHPKCIDSVLLDYERDIFEDLNALGRYNRITTPSNVTAYLLNVDGTNGVDLEQAVATPPVDVPSEENGAEAASLPEDLFPADEDLWLNLKDDSIGQHLETELTQEDVDLIEVLWKQDVDLGFSLNTFNLPKDEPQRKVPDDEDDIEKLKALRDITNASDGLGITVKNESNNEEEEEVEAEEEEEEESDPWSGLSYTVDLETGEYILKDDLVDNLNIKDEIAKDLGLKDEITSALDEHKEGERASFERDSEDSVEPTTAVDLSEESDSLLQKLSEDDGPNANDLPTVSLEEALRLAGLDDPQQELKNHLKALDEEREGSEIDEEEEDLLNEMIQTAQFHTPQTPHPRTFQASRDTSSYTNTRSSWGRMPFVRTMSMEQRWQDLANLLSLPGQEGVGMHHPFPHHPHHHHHHHHHHHGNYTGHNYSHDGRGVLLHNATLAPPMGDLNSSGPYNSPSMGSSNALGSAVATSMNLTNSSEPISDGGSVFKMETPHDLMYYQNTTSEMNQTTEGFLSSILNDEDLQLMDMAMTEGMYPMRMLESNNTNNGTGGAGGQVGHTEERLDASSDSAVSSMGSERVPSLSDGEWMETGSDSGHNTGDHYGGVDYHASKFRPFDYSYTGRQILGNSGPSGSGDGHIPPVAQKKHHMFGKRYFQEQGSSTGPSLTAHRAVTSLATAPAPMPIKYEYSESGAEAVVPPGFNGTMEPSCGPKMSEVKYSCSLDFIRHQTGGRSLDHINHNHTYPLPSEGSIAMARPSHRDKSARGRKSEEDHLTRDEKRANAMNIPMPVDEIVNLPMDEFNERLSKYDLSEAQLSLIRDIRRRGKNKVAAQNCRKRKLDQINSLADEVKQMRDRKHRLLRERDYMMAERLRVKEKFSQLYRHVFQALRDPEGNHYSPYEYSLQQSADGTVVLVPRSTSNNLLEQEAPRVKHKDQSHEQHKE